METKKTILTNEEIELLQESRPQYSLAIDSNPKDEPGRVYNQRIGREDYRFQKNFKKNNPGD